MTSLLNSLGVIKIEGAEAAKYLQGQLTADLNTLNPTHASMAALCDAKGRVQVTTVLFAMDEAYYSLVPHSMVAAALKRLKKYALFSKVSFSDETAAWHSAALINTTRATVPAFQLHISNTLIELTLPGHGARLLLLSRDHGTLVSAIHQWQQQGFETQTDPEWELSNIQARWALITPHTQELFTPQMLELEKMGGVSFSKGCYVGQEIVARTQHLGKLKRHLHRVQWQAIADVSLTAGSVITNDDGEPLGHLVNVCNTDALAVIEDRALNSMLFVGEHRLRLL